MVYEDGTLVLGVGTKKTGFFNIVMRPFDYHTKKAEYVIGRLEPGPPP